MVLSVNAATSAWAELRNLLDQLLLALQFEPDLLSPFAATRSLDVVA